MRQPTEWIEADLQQLIADEVQESVTLDYKQSDSLQRTEGKNAEVSKDVSAMANSAGGTLVYGIAEDKIIPTSLDKGVDPREISREWLEQVINSRIQPRIDGVIINQVDLASSSPGRVAYVVSVPQSPRAPHQASDKRYYKRFNFETVPMEDYEVRDVMNRTSRPLLLLDVRDTRSKMSGDGLVEIETQFIIRNESRATASFAVVTVQLAQLVSVSFPSGSEWMWITKEDETKTVRHVLASGSSKAWSPITPRFSLYVPGLTLRVPRREQDALGAKRTIAVVQLDYDGGSTSHDLEVTTANPPGTQLAVAR